MVAALVAATPRVAVVGAKLVDAITLVMLDFIPVVDMNGIVLDETAVDETAADEMAVDEVVVDETAVNEVVVVELGQLSHMAGHTKATSSIIHASTRPYTATKWEHHISGSAAPWQSRPTNGVVAGAPYERE
jgi:hypothetical protein